jgi:putative transposase
MALPPRLGHAALRRGRATVAGADYFLTLCTLGRRVGLSEPVTLESVLETMRQLESQRVWAVRSMTVMPDHIHLIVRLVGVADLSDTIRRFKGKLSPVLRRAGIRWQPAFFDHRLRGDDDELSVFLYVFLNPYRAGLVSVGEVWPGFYCSAEDWEWFGGLTNEHVPFPEWLG